jgi:hypothetical protein
VELAANLGYKDSFFKIEGHLRNGPNSPTPTHAWNASILSNGKIIFSDTQQSAVSPKIASSRNANISNPMSCPLDRWEQGLFLATHFGVVRISAVQPNSGSKLVWDFSSAPSSQELFTGDSLDRFRGSELKSTMDQFWFFTQDKGSTAVN